jgi:hypothetical protein
MRTVLLTGSSAAPTPATFKNPKEATIEFWTYRFEGEDTVPDRLWRYTLRRIQGDWYAAYLHADGGGTTTKPDCMARALGHRIFFTEDASFVHLGGFPTLRNGEWASGFPTEDALCWAQVLSPITDMYTAIEAAAELSWQLKKPVSPARVRRVAGAHGLLWRFTSRTKRVRGDSLPRLAELLR